MKWEDYLIEGTDVLKNKLNIKDGNELYKQEKEIVLERLSALYLYGMIGKYDSNHLKAIHWYLFSPIYEFAGDIRQVNLFKEHSSFLDYQEIENELNRVLDDANSKEINNNLFDIAKFIGDLYYNLIRIHPFREGNGRSIREFIRQFTSYKFPNLSLNYNKIDKKNFLLGITEHDTYPLLLAYEIYNALEKDKVKTI